MSSLEFIPVNFFTFYQEPIKNVILIESLYTKIELKVFEKSVI